jgi:hypothetical protein
MRGATDRTKGFQPEYSPECVEEAFSEVRIQDAA